MTTPCNEQLPLDAFADGQLPPDDARRVEAHLAICVACAREVARLRKLSAVFAGYRPTLSPDALARLHDAVAQSWDVGVLRIARRISAVAASVVLFGSLYLTFFQADQATAGAVPTWEQAAISASMPAAESADPADQHVQLAQWIVSDLSAAAGR